MIKAISPERVFTGVKEGSCLNFCWNVFVIRVKYYIQKIKVLLLSCTEKKKKSLCEN